MYLPSLEIMGWSRRVSAVNLASIVLFLNCKPNRKTMSQIAETTAKASEEIVLVSLKEKKITCVRRKSPNHGMQATNTFRLKGLACSSI